MALIILGKTRCAICSKTLQEGEMIVATSGVFFPQGDPLIQYCDAGMHWACYDEWPDRKRFARRYFDARVEASQQNIFWESILQTDSLFIEVNPSLGEDQIMLMFSETAITHRISLSDWEDLLEFHFARPVEWYRLEVQLFQNHINELQERLPTALSILAAIDWEHREAALEAFQQEDNQKKLQRQQELEANNKRCQELISVIRTAGLQCPHCGVSSNNYRFIDKRPDGKSYFICNHCARSIHLSDLNLNDHSR